MLITTPGDTIVVAKAGVVYILGDVARPGGILVDKASKANITDTQTATFEFENVRVVWQHRSWGDTGDPKYSWGATFYGDKGTLKTGVYGYDFIPLGGGEPDAARQALGHPPGGDQPPFAVRVGETRRGFGEDEVAGALQRAVWTAGGEGLGAGRAGVVAGILARTGKRNLGLRNRHLRSTI